MDQGPARSEKIAAGAPASTLTVLNTVHATASRPARTLVFMARGTPELRWVPLNPYPTQVPPSDALRTVLLAAERQTGSLAWTPSRIPSAVALCGNGPQTSGNFTIDQNDKEQFCKTPCLRVGSVITWSDQTVAYRSEVTNLRIPRNFSR